MLGINAKEQEFTKILEGKNAPFEEIEIIDIKFSNLQDPDDLSNVIHINKSKKNKEKSLNDYYTSFSDFEVWNSFDKQETIIASTLSGAVFFIQKGKQVRPIIQESKL